VKTANIVSENLRVAETALTWVEVLTGATGTIQLADVQTFRVRATGATTVTIDSILAMTMSAGEIALFNTGHGNPDDPSPYISVVIAGAAAFVQVGQELNRQRLQVNPYNLLNEPQGTGESP
jgi:hypothetical protein